MQHSHHTKLADRVHRHLLERLGPKDLAQGAHLNAGEIADELGVARTTVRKAIARLVEDAWVELDERRRPIVARYPRGSQSVDSEGFAFANKMEHAYLAILKQLVGGRFRLGETINGREFAEDLRVSLGTVRQALDWLARDGLLVRLPRRGWRVADFSLDDIEDCYRFRQILEGEAVQRACSNRSNVPELNRLSERFDDLLKRGAGVGASERRLADLEFHSGLARAANSPLLASLVEPLVRKSMLVGLTFPLEHVISLQAFEDHKAILDAIHAGRSNEAHTLLQSHLQRALQHFRAIFESPNSKPGEPRASSAAE